MNMESKRNHSRRLETIYFLTKNLIIFIIWLMFISGFFLSIFVFLTENYLLANKLLILAFGKKKE